VIRDNDVQAIEQTTAASLDIAATLEAIAQSARTGQPVTVENRCEPTHSAAGAQAVSFRREREAAML